MKPSSRYDATGRTGNWATLLASAWPFFMRPYQNTDP